MKKLCIPFFLLASMLLVLAGCEPVLSPSELEMTVDVQPREIRLNMANGLRQQADISYSITNNSEVSVSADMYDIMIGTAMLDSMSMTIIQNVSGDILPSETLEGNYTYHFTQVIGADGDQKVSLVVYEKNGDSMQEFKRVSVAVNVVYED